MAGETIHGFGENGELSRGAEQALEGYATKEYTGDVVATAAGAAVIEANNYTDEQVQDKVAGPNGVRRILVSTDTDIALEDGDLLLVLPEGSLDVTADPPTFNDAAKTYTIPAVIGVEYRVGGVTRAAGTYTVTTLPSTVTVTAHAKPGYTLEGTASWSGDFTSPFFWTDFSSDTTGALPDGWTKRWLTTGNAWTVETVAGATGGKALRYTGALAARQGLSCDFADGAQDVEIVYKWRYTAGTPFPRAFARGGGGSGSEVAYLGGAVSGNNAVAASYQGGTYAAHGTAASGVTYASSTWFCTRLRVEGDTIKVKIWLASGTEPGTWAVEVTNTGITAGGWAGLVEYLIATVEYDWVGIAVAGETAPTTAV